MKRMVGFPRIALFLAVSLALAMTGLVLATSITVDGDPSDWPGADDCAIMTNGCPRVINDPKNDVNYTEEPTGTTYYYPKWDIGNVYATNDTSNFYWRMDTYSDTALSGSAFIYICMDTDQDTSTGGEISQCEGAPSTSMSGVDYILYLIAVPVHGAYLYQCPDTATEFANCSLSATGSIGVMTHTIETSIPLSNVGIDTNRTISVATYFDNADSPSDDNVPDSGQLAVMIGTGSPTAVTLSTIDAGPALAGWPAFALVVAMVAGGAGLFVWKRRA
jgi:hypothetical protein